MICGICNALTEHFSVMYKFVQSYPNPILFQSVAVSAISLRKIMYCLVCDMVVELLQKSCGCHFSFSHLFKL